MTLKDTDKLIELIDDDTASLDMNMPTECYYVCLCTLQMVKLYIEALPTVEPVKMMCNGEHIKCPAHKDYERGYKDGQAEAQMNAEPVKHGRWEFIGATTRGAAIINRYACSECGYEADTTNYCSNCGTKMDGGENGTD